MLDAVARQAGYGIDFGKITRETMTAFRVMPKWAALRRRLPALRLLFAQFPCSSAHW